MALFTTNTTGLGALPGQYSYNPGNGAIDLDDKYVTAASSVLFPGLFAGRAHLGTNFTIAQSLGQITPVEDFEYLDIIGVVAKTNYGTSDGSSLAYTSMVPYAAGTRIQIMHSTGGYIYVFAGSAIDGTVPLAVTMTQTGSGSTLVYAGSLVTSAFSAGPIALVTGLVTLDALANGVTFAKGDLVPVSLQIINR